MTGAGGVGVPGDAPADPAKYCLKWNNFGRNVTSAFKALLENEELTDISLTSSSTASSSSSKSPKSPDSPPEGRILKAHKVVLSASSQFFREQLASVPPWQHPVFLLDVPHRDLEGIVEFIYHGEVSVDQECLESFLKTAQMLRVKGLTDEQAVGGGGGNGAQTAGGPMGVSATASHNGVNKGGVLQQLGSAGEEEEEEEEEEMLGDKSASTNPLMSRGGPNQQQHHHHSRKSANPKRAAIKVPEPGLMSKPLATSVGNHSDSEESEIGEFAGEIDDREEEEIAAVQQLQQQQQQQQQVATFMHHFMSGRSNKADQDMDVDDKADRSSIMSSFLESSESIHGSMGLPTVPAPPNLATMLPLPPQSIAGLDSAGALTAGGDGTVTTGAGGGNSSSQQKKTCPYCFQQLSWHALSRHIRDMHKARSAYVDCQYCGKMFRNKNSLGCHMWRFHKASRASSANSKEDGGEMAAAAGNKDGMSPNSKAAASSIATAAAAAAATAAAASTAEAD